MSFWRVSLWTSLTPTEPTVVVVTAAAVLVLAVQLVVRIAGAGLSER